MNDGRARYLFFILMVVATLARKLGLGEFGIADLAGKRVLLYRYVDVSQPEARVHPQLLRSESEGQPGPKNKGDAEVVAVAGTTASQDYIGSRNMGGAASVLSWS